MNAPAENTCNLSLRRRAAVILILLGLAVGLPGCSTHTEAKSERLKDWLSSMDSGGKDMTFEQHAAMSRVALESGDMREALRQADKCLEMKPGDARAFVLRAKALHRLDRQREALDALALALRADPADPVANLEAGRIYFASRLMPEAEQRLHAVLESREAVAGGEAYQAHMLLGALAEQRGDSEAAVRCYERALELRPGNHEALNNLGVARMMTGGYAEAAENFSLAIRSGGAQERSCNNLGLALARTGRTDEALQAFKCAGSDAKAHNNLGYVLFVQGDYQGALYHLERAVELSPVFYPQASENLKRARLAAGGVMSASPAQAPAVQPASPAVGVRPAAYISPQAAPAISPHPERARPAQRVTPPAERTISEEPEARVAPASGVGVAELASGGPVPAEVAAQVGGAGGTVRMTVAPPAAPAATPAALPVPTAASASSRSASLAPGATWDDWGLLISSWKNEEHAAAHVRKLAERGVEARIIPTDLGEKGLWQRVVWGSFPSASEALAARGENPGGIDLSRACPVRAKPSAAAPQSQPKPQVVAGSVI